MKLETTFECICLKQFPMQTKFFLSFKQVLTMPKGMSPLNIVVVFIRSCVLIKFLPGLKVSNLYMLVSFQGFMKCKSPFFTIFNESAFNFKNIDFFLSCSTRIPYFIVLSQINLFHCSNSLTYGNGWNFSKNPFSLSYHVSTSFDNLFNFIDLLIKVI